MLFARITLLVTVCSHHHLPCRGDITPSSPTTDYGNRTKQPLPPHPGNTENNSADDNGADDDAVDNDADNNADVNANNNNAMQTPDNNADNGPQRR
jgi:hypothetical protein